MPIRDSVFATAQMGEYMNNFHRSILERCLASAVVVISFLLSNTAWAEYPIAMNRVEAARSDCLFDWAERTWPNVLTPVSVSKVSEPYYYRYYPPWWAYVGISTADANVYLLDVSGMHNLGNRDAWLASADCQFDPRVWQTGFEQESDFAGFYITPQGHLGSTFQNLATDNSHGGTKAHAAWIAGANPKPMPGENTNHRGYPTIQLHKLSGGGYRTPVLVEWWVWQDMVLESPESPPIGAGPTACEWVSYATLSLDKSDAWSRVVLMNLGWEGFAHLMHLKAQGDMSWTYQDKAVSVPQRQWARLTFWLDAKAGGGRARVWVNGKLASEGPVLGGNGTLEQAHFGLYADSDCRTGKILNDDLKIYESGSFTTPPDGDAFLPEQATR